MAVSMRSKAFTASVARASPRAHTVVVRAEKGNGQGLQMAAAALFTAASLMCASPVEAGVIMAQPNLKKVDLIYNSTNAPTVKAARVAKGAAAPPSVDFAFSVGQGIDVRLLALPAAIGGIAGLGFLATKVDPEISEWFDTAFVKSNIEDGVGYEPNIKGPVLAEGAPAFKMNLTAGTKKMSPAKKTVTNKTVTNKKPPPPAKKA